VESIKGAEGGGKFDNHTPRFSQSALLLAASLASYLTDNLARTAVSVSNLHHKISHKMKSEQTWEIYNIMSFTWLV